MTDRIMNDTKNIDPAAGGTLFERDFAIFGKRAGTKTSLMGRGILSHAVRRAQKSLAASGNAEA